MVETVFLCEFANYGYLKKIGLGNIHFLKCTGVQTHLSGRDFFFLLNEF